MTGHMGSLLKHGWRAVIFFGPQLWLADAGAACDFWVAQLVSAQGEVKVMHAREAGWQPVGREEVLCAGDRLRVGAQSRAALRLPNETVLRLDAGTTVTFPAVAAERSGWLELLEGVIHFISRVPKRLQVNTPFVNAAVEGTEFVLRVKPKQTALWVFEGLVRLSNTVGSLRVKTGEGAVTEAGRAPERRMVVKPRDAVQWALYYPPLIDYRAVALTGDSEAIRGALVFYRVGKIAEALQALEHVPASRRDGRYFTLRAGLLLSVGRVEPARADIASALKLSPTDGTASALLSIIALVRNEKGEALSLARAAAELDPSSPVPLVAISYAYQAGFDLEKSLASIRRAAELAPQDALIQARLAELELSQGELERAVAAARNAVALDPDLSRTQSVLGFVYLAQIKTEAAKGAFDKAIALDPSDPLPRLGMGLAKIREGELREGVHELEDAVSLDPNNSLVRSYLGKGYYEEKREGLAATEYRVAKELDPQDPTPWFYDAILKQTTNRSVEALQDIEKAIALNDNRAVYRSRLMLDEDRAVRGTSLARIYQDNGFEQLALLEATKSLSFNPTDYSAHRFLSDTYAVVPRHEIARVSELLQAQLLQPTNAAPVPPTLAFSDLNIVAAAAPPQVTFDEFNSLYERNRLRLITSAFGGSNGTWGDDLVLSGVHDRWSFSLGQFHSNTDGFRQNNDVENDVYNAFAQVAVTPRLNLQAEYRRRETEQGDIILNFDPNDFSTRNRRTLSHDAGRVGARYALSPRSDVLVSLAYGDRVERLDRFERVFVMIDGNVLLQDLNLRVDEQDTGYQVEAQYLLRTDWLNLTAGLGHNDFTRTTRSVVNDFVFNPPDTPEQQTTAYLYSNINWPKPLVWTAGFSYDFYEQQRIDLVDSVHPKLGLRWSLTDDSSVRMAYMKTVKGFPALEQTIEPTQVAGFNQFYDDFNGTQATLYGIGLDTRLKADLAGGIELSRRDLTIPQPTPFEAGFVNEKRQEDLISAYLNWTFYRDWAMTTALRLDRFRLLEQPGFSTAPTRVDTTSVPIDIRYFNPSGFFAKLGVTYVRQDVELSPLFVPSFPTDGNDFVLVDAAVGYRLPKRWGIVSLEARNLLDERFFYQDDNFRTSEQRNPRFIPDQVILARITLNF